MLLTENLAPIGISVNVHTTIALPNMFWTQKKDQQQYLFPDENDTFVSRFSCLHQNPATK